MCLFSVQMEMFYFFKQCAQIEALREKKETSLFLSLQEETKKNERKESLEKQDAAGVL